MNVGKLNKPTIEEIDNYMYREIIYKYRHLTSNGVEPIIELIEDMDVEFLKAIQMSKKPAKWRVSPECFTCICLDKNLICRGGNPSNPLAWQGLPIERSPDIGNGFMLAE